jgi:hypothetical protein
MRTNELSIANATVSPDRGQGFGALMRLLIRRNIMVNKAEFALVATIATLSIAAPAAGRAQSAYTTGTVESSQAAGYPSPSGYGGGLYAYVPGYSYGHAIHYRHSRCGRPRIDVRLSGCT